MNTFDPESQFASPHASTATIEDLWKKFKEHFPTEESCLYELSRIILEEPKDCPHCGSKQECTAELQGRRMRCPSCNKNIWVTAGTFFARIRKPRAWLFGIWVLGMGKTFSASEFHKVVDIVYSTSWTLLKKLSVVIEQKMEDECFDHLASFCFSKIFSKRSRQTPACQHPVDEEEGAPENSPRSQSNFTQAADTEFGSKRSHDTQADSASAVSTLTRTEQEVYESLTGEPCHSDMLCDKTGIPTSVMSSILTTLELTYLAERIPGGLYKRRLQKTSKLVNPESALHTAALKAFLKFVKKHFHGISRKYLQFYLAIFWCNVHRRRWSPGSLLRECIGFREITYKEILEYVSPPVVVICADFV